MLLLGGGEMAFVRDAIHFCYCCHSELSTFFFLSLFGCDSGSEGIRSKSWFSSVVVRVPSPSSHFSFSSNLMQANFRICLHLSAWNIHRWLTLGTLQRINGKIKESKHHIHWRCTQEWTVYLLNEGGFYLQGSYRWIIMHEKCGHPDSNGFQLKWRFGTHGNWKNQNPGGCFGATS